MGRPAAARVRPPALRSSAYRESREEREAYRKRFHDARIPREFRDKFFDQKLAVRMLERKRRRQVLATELVIYTVLVVFYCIYLFYFVALPEAYAFKLLFSQTLASRPFNFEGVFYRYTADDGAAGSHCVLPFRHDKGVVMDTPAANSIPCYEGVQSLTFAQISNLDQTYGWLQFVLEESRLFAGGPSRAQEVPTVASDLGSAPENVAPLIMPDEAFVPVGAVRLRQLRVKQTPCTAAKADADTDASAGQTLCNLPYAPENLNTSSFRGAASEQMYTFQSAASLGRTSLQVQGSSRVRNLSLDASEIMQDLQFPGVTGWYPASGFVYDVEGGNGTTASEAFERLREDRWLDDATVALFVSFTAYSLNLDTYVFQTFMVELNPHGLAATSMETRPFRLPSVSSINTAQKLEILLMTLASLLLVLLLVFHLRPLLQRRSLRAVFFGWTMYDMLNLSMVIASVAMRVHVRGTRTTDVATETETLVSLMTENRGVYVTTFDAYSRVLLKSQMVAAWSLILCFLKFFKYMDLDKRFSIALTSMVESRTRLAGWLVFTLVVVFGLTLFCLFAYGFYSLRYSSFAEALTSVLLYVLQIFGEGFAVFESADLAATPSQSTLSFVALRYGSASLPMSLPTFQIVDEHYSIPFVQSLFFAFVFATVVIILITNMFQAILIFGYQNVAQQVQEDEDLRREQRETLLQSQLLLNQSWLRRHLKAYGTWKLAKITSQLQSAPETRARNLLSFVEVERIVSEVILDPRHATEVTLELMSLYQTKLSRLDDAVVIFKDLAIALREGRLHDALDPSELPVVDAAGGLDPAQSERWLRDLQSGELIQSMLLVHSLQLESSAKSFKASLDAISQAEREVRELAILVEDALQELQTKIVDDKGDIFISRDPWDARPASVVEARIDGAFDAHHVAAEGRHTYLGSFATRVAAQSAIDGAAARFERDAARARSRGGSRTEAAGMAAPATPSFVRADSMRQQGQISASLRWGQELGLAAGWEENSVTRARHRASDADEVGSLYAEDSSEGDEI